MPMYLSSDRIKLVSRIWIRPQLLQPVEGKTHLNVGIQSEAHPSTHRISMDADDYVCKGEAWLSWEDIFVRVGPTGQEVQNAQKY